MRRNSLGLVFDLQRFAEGEGAGDAGSGGSPNAGGEGSGGAGGTQEPNGAGEGAGGEGNKGGKVEFTPEQQATIDALVAQRVARAEKSAGKKASKETLESKAKELGYESAEAMETALQAHKDDEEKKKSDLDKEKEARSKAEAKATEAQEKATTALKRAAVKEAAIAANMADTDDAFRLGDLSEVEVKDDGTVTGAKEAVEALVKAKPYLVKQEGGSDGGGGGGNPLRGKETPDDDAAKGKQMAQQRNQQSRSGGIDPWNPGGGPDQTQQIAETVAAAVASALKTQNK